MSEAHYVLLIYVFIIINNGFKTPPLVRASHPAVSLRRQAHSRNQHEGETSLHIHHPIHLPGLQSNPHLRGAARVGHRPLHVDEGHPGFQSWHFDVVGPIAGHLGRLDLAAAHRSRYNKRGSSQLARFETVLGIAEIAGHDFGFWGGFRAGVVGVVWQFGPNWTSKRHSDSTAVDGIRLHSYSARLNVTKRIWSRFGCIPVHRRQHLLEHPMEKLKPHHATFLVRHRILGCPDRPSAPPNNQAQQNLRPVPGLLPHIQPQPSKPARNRGSVLPSDLPAGL